MRRRGDAALAHHDAVPRDLPTGDVTFLFTDVEGSTKLLHELGEDRYAEALAAHRRVLREAFGAHGGVEVDTQGDSFFVAFPTAQGALQAATATLNGLAAGPISVRIGVHTGTRAWGRRGMSAWTCIVQRESRPVVTADRCWSRPRPRSLSGPAGLRDLGYHRLKDLSEPERIYQLGDERLSAARESPPDESPVAVDAVPRAPRRAG